MAFIQDFKWKKGMSVKDLVSSYQDLGYQSIELKKASDVIILAQVRVFYIITSNLIC